jgi:tRNA G18 (ribose-2'-O)-methylase SpoU
MIESARCPLCAIPYEAEARAAGVTCPGCGRAVRPRLLRHEEALARRAGQAGPRTVRRGDLYLLAEDVRSLWNVGSLFRSADGLGVAHLFLCGITGIPPHPEISRTALGAEETVSWSYARHGLEALAEVPDVPVVALEQTDRSTELAALPRPLVLVVGHEVQGVSPELLDAAGRHVHIGMRGTKRSLNVAVAAGIALWACR